MDRDNKPKVVDFFEKTQSLKELKDYARAQYVTLVSANERIESLEAENRELHNKIDVFRSKVKEADSNIAIIPKSQEQSVCEIEIRRLYEISLERSLTMEEVKKFDLFVKNLYIAKGKPEALDGKAKKLKDLSHDELLGIVSSTPEE